MLHFESDYANGACEDVLQALVKTNGEQTPGYGEDAHCAAAASAIRGLCGAKDAAVHFLVGGTQVNQIVIASALRPHEGVLCAQTGHIAVHETGAVEATGHKVLSLPSADGKLSAAQVDQAARSHREDLNREHMVKPGLVYISLPTENGGLYTGKELSALYAACRKNDLFLYVDGARLGYGLAAAKDGLDLPFVAKNCDAFTIGGTKQGALFGEALVLVNPALQKDFRYHIKQRGGMLAKGRLLGVQFEALLGGGAYFHLSQNAIRQARRISAALEDLGVPFLYPPETNQLFPIFTRAQEDYLSKELAFSPWEKLPDGRVCLRLCTSWATQDTETEALIALLRRMKQTLR